MSRNSRRFFGLVLNLIILPASAAGTVECLSAQAETFFRRAPARLVEEFPAARRDAAVADTAGLFVLYILQVVELKSLSSEERLFSGEAAKPAGGWRVTATPESLRGENGMRFILEKGVDFRARREQGEAWLMTVPGRTVRWSAGFVYPERTDHEKFVCELTPTLVDRTAGRVESVVVFGLGKARSGDSGHLTATVRSGGRTPEIIAFMRRAGEEERRGLFSAGLAGKHRDFAVLLAAVPLGIKDQAAAALLPVGSLKGLDFLAPVPPPPPQRPREIEAGLVFGAGGGIINPSSSPSPNPNPNPVLRLVMPVDDLTRLEMSVQGPASYFTGIQRELWPGAETFLAVTLSSGTGPAAAPVLTAGIGDAARPADKARVFAAWYPLVLPLYPGTAPEKNNWRAGMEVECGRLTLGAVFTGGPGFSRQRWQAGRRLRENLRLRLEMITEKKVSPGFFLGLGFTHAR